MKLSRLPIFFFPTLWILIGPMFGLAQNDAVTPLKIALASHTGQDTQRVLLLCDYAWAVRSSGDGGQVKPLEEALSLATNLHYTKGIGESSVQLGTYFREKGDYDLADKFFDQAIDARREIHDFKGVASVYNNKGTLEKDRGDFIQAEEYYLSAFQIAVAIKDSIFIAKFANQLCSINRVLGDYRKSIDYGLKSLFMRENQTKPDSGEIGKTWMAIGLTHEAMEENERAKADYTKAKRCFEASKDNAELGNVLNNLGNVEGYDAHYDEALEFYQQSYSIRMQRGDTLNATKNLRNIAKMYRNKREFPRAKAKLEAALLLLATTEDSTQTIIIQADLAELYLWEGSPKITVKMLTQWLPRIDSLSDPAQQIYFRHILSLALAANQDFKGSLIANLDATRLRRSQEWKISGGSYRRENYLSGSLQYQRIQFNSKILEQDVLIEKERSKLLWFFILALVLLLILVGFASLQRLRMLQNKRKALEAKLQLEMKENEIHQFEQAKKVEFLEVALDVEDRERSRIAHDLHDRVGAQLAAFKHLYEQMIAGIATTSPTSIRQFDKLNQELETLLVEVRAVSHDLESPTLKQFGLVAALQGFQEMFASASNLSFELDVHGLDKRLAAKTEQHIYLILKELFSNALRHGKATSFSIQLFQDQDELTILVEDNGQGFDPDKTPANAGLGLRSIHNRVQSMHGKIDFDSVIGRGTTITIEIPIN